MRPILLLLALPSAALSQELTAVAPTPLPGQPPVFAGTWDVATQTLIPPGDSGPAAGASEVIYDNTCDLGWWYEMCETTRFVDWGRLPSPSSTDGITGDLTSYRIDGFEIGYVTGELDQSHGGSGTNLEVSFWENYVPCAQPWSSPDPDYVLGLNGLPGAPPNQLAFYTIKIEWPFPLCLRADGDGVFDGQALGDSFAWSLKHVNPTATAGILIAGDPNLCATGDGTRWQNPDLPGTGLGNDNRFVVTHDLQEGCDGWTPFCYEHPDFTGFHLRVYSSAAAVCTDPGEPYCFGTNCFCGNMDALAGCRNSTGQGAYLNGFGSNSLVLDDLTLLADRLPPFTFAMLIWGPDQQESQIGSGTLCVGGGLRRLQPAQGSGPTGRALFGPGIVAANDATYGDFASGETWNFQVWYRDEPMCELVGMHNLTNAYAVTFVP